MKAYLKRSASQVQVEVIDLFTQTETIFYFGKSVDVRFPMVRYRYRSGKEGSASLSIVQERPFPGIPIE